MELPDFGVAFLRDVLLHREALLCVARKNAKSATIAVFILALLAGPLRRPGLRIGVASVTQSKSAELLRQCSEIIAASELQGVELRKSPTPGWLLAANGSTCEFLSADKVSGHASGFDYSIFDELGLCCERDRALVNGLRTATSARDGRFLALSVRGESPMLEEMLERRELPTCAVHHFAPELPERKGRVCLGLDMGGATSGTACAAIWPQSGRLELWLAFGDNPSLVERGRFDGARYDLMAERGELRVYPGRVTPVAAFLGDVAADLSGCRVHRLSADGYKDAEVLDALERAGLRWPYEFRRVGAGKDGGRDCRAAQRLIIG